MEIVSIDLKYIKGSREFGANNLINLKQTNYSFSIRLIVLTVDEIDVENPTLAGC